MTTRFRPTSFQVAFGNTDEQQPTRAEPATPPVIIPPQKEDDQVVVDMRPVRIPSVAETEFEQIVVREEKCVECHCYSCGYRRHMHERKLNFIIFLLIVIVIMLFMYKKSA